MGTLTRRRDSKGKFRYREQVQIKNFPAQSRTFGNQKMAEKWMRETEDELRSGKYFLQLETQRHTVADMIDRYLKEEVHKLRSRSARTTELLWFRDEIGKYNLSQLTPALVVDCRTKLMNQESTRGKRAPATINRYLAALRACCTLAMKEWMWIEENPCFKVRLLPEDNERERYLSEDERIRLLKVCQKINTALYLAVVISLSTGARRMNVWSLRWTNIDLTEGEELVKFPITKNGEPLELPLTGVVVPLLHQYKESQPTNSDLLFPSTMDPNKPFDFRAGFQKALKQAKINDFRWHDLRHSTGSYLGHQRVPLVQISKILGHRSTKTTMRYIHVGVNHLRPDLENITKKLDPLQDGE